VIHIQCLALLNIIAKDKKLVMRIKNHL